MKTIEFNNKTYECKRYTREELKQLFDGYVVYIEDGVLVGVGTTEEKDKYAIKYIKEGRSVDKIDFSPEPLIIPLQMVVK